MIPPKLTIAGKDQNLLAYIRRLEEQIQRNKLVSSKGFRIKSGPKGTTLEHDGSTSGGGGSLPAVWQ